MKKLAFSTPFLGLALPAVAFAQTNPDSGWIFGIIGIISGVLNALIPILIAAALVAFFWGLVNYIWSEKKENGRNLMIYGLIALFVMVSVWGIIRLAGRTLGISEGGTVNVPQVPAR